MSISNRRSQYHFALQIVILLAFLLGACSPNKAAPTQTTVHTSLIYYDWEGMIPQDLLDKFTQQTGIRVDYQTFESQAEAITNIENGKGYDVVNIESDFIPDLVSGKFLAAIDTSKVSNLKFVNSDFLGQAYDPKNEYTVPNSWGTTGLIIRTDLLDGASLARWEDLWSDQFSGKIAIYRDEPVTTIAVALKSMGISINTDDPLDIRKAEERMNEIKGRVIFVSDDEEAATVLASGDAVACIGFSGTALQAMEKNSNIDYILPDEGSMIWTDNYVVPAASEHLDDAFLLINFLHDPKNNAEIVNSIYYATANEMARSYIDPEILNNPVIYPQPIEFQNAEFFLPHSNELQSLEEEIWANYTIGN